MGWRIEESWLDSRQGAKDSSLLQSAQFSRDVHSASRWVGTSDSFLGRKPSGLGSITHLHPVLRLRMSEALYPLPRIQSWGTQGLLRY